MSGGSPDNKSSSRNPRVFYALLQHPGEGYGFCSEVGPSGPTLAAPPSVWLWPPRNCSPFAATRPNFHVPPISQAHISPACVTDSPVAAVIRPPPATPISRGCVINGAAVEPVVYRIGSVTVLGGESRADSPAESSRKLADKPSGKLADAAENERDAIAATAGTAARVLATVPQEDASRFCPVCSQRLESRRCKLICNVCGYYMSCADYY